MSDLLTTDDVSPAERVAYWREMICSAYVDLDAEPKTRGPFHGSVSLSSWGDTRLSRVESDAQLVRRKPGSPVADCLLSLQMTGSAAVSQSGRTAMLAPGDWVLYDATAPYELSFDEHFSQLVLQFPRDALISRDVHIESTVARRCRAVSGMGAIASNFLHTLADNDDTIPDNQRNRLGSQALDFVATALAQLTGSSASAESVRESDRQRILEYLNQNLTNPDLNVSAIARAFGVSARTVQKLFADDPIHLSERIRRARIERAKAILRDPMWNHHTITRVAYDLGFSSPGVFSRIFKAWCGCTPREFRAAHAT